MYVMGKPPTRYSLKTEHLNRIYVDAPTYAKEKLVETTERSTIMVDSSSLPRRPQRAAWQI
jgi:hypothetical protein